MLELALENPSRLVTNQEIDQRSDEIATSLTYRPSGGKYSVKLTSVGNPDYDQDPDRPMYGVPDLTAHVDTMVEARGLCLKYIALFDLGGGNWSGGQLVRADGLVIGRFSYNGRLWADSTDGRREIAVID
jgi:hypothetical protein